MFHGVSAFVAQSSLVVLPSTKSIFKQPLFALVPGGGFADEQNLESPHQVSTTMILRGLTKNANLYWAAATGLAVWFLFLHTPTFWRRRRFLVKRDTLLAIHIVTAGIVYLTCVHNCLLTPSLHFATKWLHRWIGRFGLLSGLVSFSLGAFLAWSRLGIAGEGSTTLGFAVPITIGGILQLQCEYKGFRAIRAYKALQSKIQELQAGDQGNDRDKLEALLADQKRALGTHVGYMSPGPIYSLPTEKVLTV